MGGFGTWHMIARFPERFARAASISGAGYGSVSIPEDIDPCAIETEVRLIHGTEDPVALPALVPEAIGAINEQCSASHSIEFLEGEGHFTTFQRTYGDDEFLEWLLRG